MYDYVIENEARAVIQDRLRKARAPRLPRPRRHSIGTDVRTRSDRVDN